MAWFAETLDGALRSMRRKMASIYDFTCATCGYAARVSGGNDCFGAGAATTTVLCRSCEKLRDVVVMEKVWDAASARDPRCPRSRKHEVSLWAHPGPCPKCGATMERPEMPSLLLD